MSLDFLDLRMETLQLSHVTVTVGASEIQTGCVCVVLQLVGFRVDPVNSVLMVMAVLLATRHAVCSRRAQGTACVVCSPTMPVHVSRLTSGLIVLTVSLGWLKLVHRSQKNSMK